MARGKITVETSDIDAVAQKVTTMANEYQTKYSELFTKVDELKTAWTGKDNVAFTSQIGEFKNDFQNMKNLMDDYANYLKTTSNRYQQIQEEMASNARTLNTGN